MHNAILGTLFWGMIGLSLFVFVYPWRFHSHRSRLLLHTPLALLVVFIIYESLMPSEMNIRVDLLLLLPLFVGVLLCYLVKLAFMSRRRKSETSSNQPVEATADPSRS